MGVLPFRGYGSGVTAVGRYRSKAPLTTTRRVIWVAMTRRIPSPLVLRLVTSASAPLIGIAVLDPACDDPICRGAKVDLGYSTDFVEPVDPQPVGEPWQRMVDIAIGFRRAHAVTLPYAVLGPGETWPLAGSLVIAPFDGDDHVHFNVDAAYAQSTGIILFLKTSQRPSWLSPEEAAEGTPGVLRSFERIGREPIELLKYALVHPEPGVAQLTRPMSMALSRNLIEPPRNADQRRFGHTGADTD